MPDIDCSQGVTAVMQFGMRDRLSWGSRRLIYPSCPRELGPRVLEENGTVP